VFFQISLSAAPFAGPDGAEKCTFPLLVMAENSTTGGRLHSVRTVGLDLIRQCAWCKVQCAREGVGVWLIELTHGFWNSSVTFLLLVFDLTVAGRCDGGSSHWFNKSGGVNCVE
jgi:hypothetical protein